MYKIKVNSSHSFNISKEIMETLDAVETIPNNYHILQDDTTINASVIDSNFSRKSYAIKVNNNVYDVVINDDLDQQIEALGIEIGATKQVNYIKAPMPGLILEITVNEAQEVKENDPLLILEAMKMENIINSPRDGIIKSISVKKGETVDKNSLLITFE